MIHLQCGTSFSSSACVHFVNRIFVQLLCLEDDNMIKADNFEHLSKLKGNWFTHCVLSDLRRGGAALCST